VKRNLCSTYAFSRHHKDDMLDAIVIDDQETVNH